MKESPAQHTEEMPISEAIRLPGVFERIKASFIDGIVILAMIFIVAIILSFFNNVSVYVRGGAFIFIFLFYEPTLVSLRGGSIGHDMAGLAIKRANKVSSNLLFPLAILRFLIKTALGIVSLFVVNQNPNKKAIHDFLSGSMVIYKKDKETLARNHSRAANKGSSYWRAQHQSWLVIIMILAVFNILLALNVLDLDLQWWEILNSLVLGTIVGSFLLGSLLALIPYKGLPYGQKQLNLFMITMLGIQGFFFIMIFLASYSQI